MHKSQWTEHGGKKPHSKLWEVVLCQEKKIYLSGIQTITWEF